MHAIVFVYFGKFGNPTRQYRRRIRSDEYPYEIYKPSESAVRRPLTKYKQQYRCYREMLDSNVLTHRSLI